MFRTSPTRRRRSRRPTRRVRRGYSTFSATEWLGQRASSWKTRPTRRSSGGKVWIIRASK
jgi:hypothetical protein